MTGPSGARGDSAVFQLETVTLNSHPPRARSQTIVKVTTATVCSVCVWVRVCSIAWFSCLLLWSWRRQEGWNWGGLCGAPCASGSSREWHSVGRTQCVLVVRVVSRSHLQNIFTGSVWSQQQWLQTSSVSMYNIKKKTMAKFKSLWFTKSPSILLSLIITVCLRWFKTVEKPNSCLNFVFPSASHYKSTQIWKCTPPLPMESHVKFPFWSFKAKQCRSILPNSWSRWGLEKKKQKMSHPV